MENPLDVVDDRPRDAAFFVESALDDLECADVDLNRFAARRAARIAEAVALARRHVEVYVPNPGPDDVEFAERGAILDIALRLKCSEDHVRSILFVAERAMTDLPLLWQRAREGFAAMYLVERAVGSLARLRVPEYATDEERDAERQAMRIVDESASEWAGSCTPVAFQRRLRTLVDRLDPLGPSVRHARAMRDRRVFLQHEENGMSWFSAYLPTHEAIAGHRRLTSTAKHLQKDKREGRTRDQIRADLFSAWIRGEKTATAVKTKLFVTIPVQLLVADSLRSVGKDGGNLTAGLPERPAEIVGHGPIDPLTAKQLFLDAKAFRRVIVDPFTSVVLDMDRSSRRATPAQREWLVLQHGTCARDGCDRLAADAEVDHDVPWSMGGKTDIGELRPLCPRDHVHRHRTTMRYRSRPDRTVQVITPTGFETEPDPPF